MMMTTTIEDIAKMLTPEVIDGYKTAPDKSDYVGKFCAEKYHTKSDGMSLLVDRLMANSMDAIKAHGLVIPIRYE